MRDDAPAVEPRPGGPIAAALVATLLGCASPLEAPPPSISEMRGSPVPSPLSTGDDALSRAVAFWGQRPDRSAVAAAADAFLEAAEASVATADRLNALEGASRAYAWLSAHSEDEDEREAFALRVIQAGQLCEEAGAEHSPCRYWIAIGLGLDARERKGAGFSAVPRIIAILERVVAQEPALDDAGPHRVLARLYLEAPGWPVSQGDPDLALEHAKQAVEIAPAHPPNQLVLADAMRKTGDDEGSREAYRRALQEAERLRAQGDPDADEWRVDASEALERLYGV